MFNENFKKYISYIKDILSNSCVKNVLSLIIMMIIILGLELSMFKFFPEISLRLQMKYF